MFAARVISAVDTAGRKFQLDRHLDFWMKEIDPVWSLRQIRARVVDVVRETHDVKTFVLAPNRRWPGHTAGQFVNVEMEIRGARVSRCYSLSSAPGARDLTITVKRVPGGRVSSWMHEALRPGSLVTLGAPSGDFVVHDPSAPLLLLSGGSGITPVMSILRDLAAKSAVRDVVFVHAARSLADVPFARELQALALHHPGLRLEIWNDDQRGRLDGARLASMVPDLGARRTMLCGPAPMMDAFTAHYERLAIADRLKTERFAAPQRPTLLKTQPKQKLKLGLLDSKTTIEAGGDGSLLEQLEDAGVRPASGCRMGICNTCICRKKQGVVENLLTGELSSEPDEDVRLCVSRARTDVTLAL